MASVIYFTITLSRRSPHHVTLPLSFSFVFIFTIPGVANLNETPSVLAATQPTRNIISDLQGLSVQANRKKKVIQTVKIFRVPWQIRPQKVLAPHPNTRIFLHSSPRFRVYRSGSMIWPCSLRALRNVIAKLRKGET